MDIPSLTVQELLRMAADRLREAGVDTPILDAELLLAKASGRTRTELLTHPDLQPTSDVVGVFEEWVGRRSRRDPLPYITGEREFYGISFHVSPSVLIPRQETEFLVDTAIHALRTKPAPRVIDIGLGSGAIALSITLNVPDALVYGSEVSPAALEIARENAQRLQVEDRILFRQGDLFEPFPDITFDLIVSNPPYIPTAEIPTLQPEVSHYEPRQALDGGPDGLDCYRRLIPEAFRRLNQSGIFAVEVGIREANQVMRMCERSGFLEVRAIKDYGGIDRVVIGMSPSAVDSGPGPLTDFINPESLR